MLSSPIACLPVHKTPGRRSSCRDARARSHLDLNAMYRMIKKYTGSDCAFTSSRFGCQPVAGSFPPSLWRNLAAGTGNPTGV